MIWRAPDLDGVNEMVAKRQAGLVGGVNDGTPDGGKGIILYQHASLCRKHGTIAPKDRRITT